MHIKSNPELKIRSKFQQFYSNGPPYIEEKPFYLRKQISEETIPKSKKFDEKYIKYLNKVIDYTKGN